MRTFRIALAVLAVLVVAPPAGAKGALGCVVVKDATGDVEVTPAAWSAGGGETHTDLRGAAILAREGRVTTQIFLEDLDAGRGGEWRITFTTRGKSAYLAATVTRSPAGPVATFSAGVAGEPAVAVHGGFDPSLDIVAVSAPLAAFGTAAPRDRDVLRDFSVTSVDRIGVAGADVVRFSDAAASRDTYAAPRHCNHRFP